MGPAAHPAAGWPPWPAPSSSAARTARTRCRPRSPPATPARSGPEDTDWARITQLYGVLAGVQPSPVVELNRAVALSMAYGPQAGLDLVDQLVAEPSLRNYHLLASVRGDLLMKLGRPAEAQAEFERAAGLTRNGPERELTALRAQQARRARTAG